MANEIVKKESTVAQISKSKVSAVVERLKQNDIKLSQEQIKCGIALSSSILATLQNQNISINSIEPNSINDALQKSILLELNANASPNECYIQLRNYKKSDGTWGKKIEFGVEGSGHEKLLKKFGIDVDALGQVWKVREDDEWKPPTYNGFEPTPPKWIPTGKGKVVRVVYPIKKKNGVVEYHMAEREDVLPNLIAHIRQNMMKESDAKTKSILDKVQKLGLDKSLEDAEILANVSPSWKDPHSRESMILRKMINNSIRKYPKNFTNSLLQEAYQTTTDERLKDAIEDKDDFENNGDIIDIDENEYNSIYPEENDEKVIEEETPKSKSKAKSTTIKKETKKVIGIDEETGEVFEPIEEPIEPIETVEPIQEPKSSSKQEKKVEQSDANANDNDMRIAIELSDAYAMEATNGKYQGKTFSEIKEENKSWFKYMDEKFPDYNTDFMKAIRFIREHDSEVD